MTEPTPNELAPELVDELVDQVERAAGWSAAPPPRPERLTADETAGLLILAGRVEALNATHGPHGESNRRQVVALMRSAAFTYGTDPCSAEFHDLGLVLACSRREPHTGRAPGYESHLAIVDETTSIAWHTPE